MKKINELKHKPKNVTTMLDMSQSLYLYLQVSVSVAETVVLH